jgi:hypothetical protein
MFEAAGTSFSSDQVDKDSALLNIYPTFRKAAKELYLSQPAVSLQIKALDEDLGIQLFDRTWGAHYASLLFQHRPDRCIALRGNCKCHRSGCPDHRVSRVLAGDSPPACFSGAYSDPDIRFRFIR